MNRKIFILACSLLMLLGISSFSQAGKYPFMDHQGYIISLSDIHNGVADKASQELAKAFASFDTPPRYIFVGGDLTEMGTRYEYGKLKKNWEPVLGHIPFGWILGNHDARWSDQAYYLFEQELGPHYFSVDLGKFVFIGLNSSTLLEQHGHFGDAQAAWLKAKLAEIGPKKPIIIQAHHPFGGPSQYTDDGYKIFDLIKPYNVPLIIVGHGHSFKVQGSYNHSWVQMIGAGMNKNYCPISWDNQYLYLWEANLDKDANLLVKIPFENTKYEAMDLISEVAYRNGIIHMFLDTRGIKQVKATFNGEMKTYDLEHDGVQSLKWPLKNPLSGKDLLQIEGRGTKTTMLLTAEVSGELTELKWAFASGDSLYTQPAVDEEFVYFGNEAGTFYALDKLTGKKIWSFQTNAAILSSPIFSDNLVIFGSTDTHVYALEKKTGTLIWKTPLGGVIYGGVVNGKQNLAVGTGDYHIYSLNPADGKILWKTLGWGMIQSTGTYDDGKFIFTSWGGVVIIIDELTGKTVQTFASGAGYETPAPSIPKVFNGRVFFTNTGNKYTGQSLTDRKNYWTITDTSTGYSSVAIDGTHGYLSSLKGEIFQFDPKNGEKTWSVTIPQPIYDSAPQLFKNHLVVGTTEGDIWILRRSNGEIMKHLSLGGGFIFGKIRATEDTLFVGSMDGTLYAVNISDL